MPRRAPTAGLRRFATGYLWLVLGLIFLGIGLQKLTAYEAFAVRPYAASSPFLAHWYEWLGVRNASRLFAAVEVLIGLGLLSGLRWPTRWPARAGALLAAGTSFITASFLFTAPGVLVADAQIPLLTLGVGQLFLKDLVLLGAALLLFAESLGGRR
ncbi:DUF417 family protein [Phenylobacterium sp.]|uniref:DUF417 family protein n=1 Tax=Phenylobacterium sp. TaxID=1871053 RepID=UPI0035B1D6AF